jgi:hypothetical protein
MKQIITNRNQTTISITNGDSHVFIQTNHDSPSFIQVNTGGIHIQIQTGGSARVNPTYDTYEEVKPLTLPRPVTPPPVNPKPPVGPKPIKPGFNFWPFKKSITYISDLPIQTTEFVRLALLWCEQNIEKSKRPYTYELKYYKAKKVMGTYQYSTRKITVYV